MDVAAFGVVGPNSLFLLQLLKGNDFLIMADNSTLMSDTGRSLLADSSILDSKVTEISKENILVRTTSDGKGNGKSSVYRCEYLH